MMNLTGNTILITGGSEGIGFALAQALVPNNTVIVCGRNKDKLARSKSELPGVLTEVCDVTNEEQRRAMVARLIHSYPSLNVLVNNAGAKRYTELISGEGVKDAMAHDMALNFTAPVALCTELLPHLLSQPHAAIVNMSTGLVYLPKVEQTFYCAGKAALHSYTQSLSWALKGSAVEVYEALLSLVNTNFHHGELPKTIPAISAEEAAHCTLEGIRQGRRQIHVGKAALARWFSLLAPQRGMAIVNR